VKQKTCRINEDVPLFAFDLFSRIIAVWVNVGPLFLRFLRFGYQSRKQWDWPLDPSSHDT